MPKKQPVQHRKHDDLESCEKELIGLRKQVEELKEEADMNNIWKFLTYVVKRLHILIPTLISVIAVITILTTRFSWDKTNGLVIYKKDVQIERIVRDTNTQRQKIDPQPNQKASAPELQHK